MSIDSEARETAHRVDCLHPGGRRRISIPAGVTATAEAVVDTEFKLYSAASGTLREADTVAETFIMYFQG